jgi:hypothetical protein
VVALQKRRSDTKAKERKTTPKTQTYKTLMLQVHTQKLKVIHAPQVMAKAI